jgi:hypothetical protein
MGSAVAQTSRIGRSGTEDTMKTALPVSFEFHRSFYLTLISMIQSLALGYLLTILDLGAMRQTTYVLQVIATFTAIVLVWHEYAVGTVLYVWVIDLLDSVIPFVLGLAQYFLITTLKRGEWGPKWWLGAFGFFGVVSLLAFMNQFLKAAKYNENKRALGAAMRRETILYVLGAVLLFLALGVAAHFVDPNGPMTFCLVLVATLAILVFAGRGLCLYPPVMRNLMSTQSSPNEDVGHETRTQRDSGEQ